MLSFPVALVFGIVGILRDSHKLLSVITAIIAAGFVFFYLFRVVVFTMIC